MIRLSAAIDLGTNTARLLVGSIDGPIVVHNQVERRITRLGGGFSTLNGIAEAAQERTVAALKDFADILAKQGIDRVRAVATSAVRDAANGQQFCERVYADTGIRLEVIDGDTEAQLTLRGVLAGLDERPQTLMVFDVGGGSTEYTIANGVRTLFTESLPLGVVRLSEGKVTIPAMAEKISRELACLRRRIEEAGLLTSLAGATLVGTAGTATTLAAISLRMSEYDYRRVNNYRINLPEIRRIYELLRRMSPNDRLSVPGLEAGREDLIIAGILITVQTMETFGFSSLKVSDFGLLEGVLQTLFPDNQCVQLATAQPGDSTGRSRQNF
jgi:exopolyphosphatase / guanosine-5'-triphosphate,3'-diphosphate pyrophosphatase